MKAEFTQRNLCHCGGDCLEKYHVSIRVGRPDVIALETLGDGVSDVGQVSERSSFPRRPQESRGEDLFEVRREE